MSYESAPGTKLLATHCAVCARPLLDAKSVELGIGPVCREEHGFNVQVDETARKEANEIVHAIALEHSTRGPVHVPAGVPVQRVRGR